MNPEFKPGWSARNGGRSPYSGLSRRSMRPCLMDALVERDRRPFQGFKRHRAGEVRHIEQLFGAAPAHHASGERRLCAVQKSQAFLCLKRQWLDTKTVERFASADSCGNAEDFAFTNQYQSKMRQWCQVSAGTDTATAGNDWIE